VFFLYKCKKKLKVEFSLETFDFECSVVTNSKLSSLIFS
jgi:hypothetical protein